MYICICVYMHICIYVCMYICINVYMYICIHVCIYTYMCIHIYIYIYMYIQNLSTEIGRGRIGRAAGPESSQSSSLIIWRASNWRDLRTKIPY